MQSRAVEARRLSALLTLAPRKGRSAIAGGLAAHRADYLALIDLVEILSGNVVTFVISLVVCPAKNVACGGSGERAACRVEGRAHDDRRGADMFPVSLSG